MRRDSLQSTCQLGSNDQQHRMIVGSSFRLGGTSGDVQSNLPLKAGSPVRSDQAAQGFSQAHLKSLQGLTEPAQPFWATSTACLSSWGRMLHIFRPNLSYLTLIIPISTAVKSLAPSSQWSANANHPIACQVDFLACLQFIRNLFDSP